MGGEHQERLINDRDRLSPGMVLRLRGHKAMILRLRRVLDGDFDTSAEFGRYSAKILRLRVVLGDGFVGSGGTGR